MKCRDSGNECLTVKCDLFRAGRLLRKKNGESFQEPWYFEVQKIGPETRNEVLKRLKRLSCKTVTDVSPKNFDKVSGRIGLFGNEKTDDPQEQGSTPVLTEKNCPN